MGTTTAVAMATPRLPHRFHGRGKDTQRRPSGPLSRSQPTHWPSMTTRLCWLQSVQKKRDLVREPATPIGGMVIPLPVERQLRCAAWIPEPAALSAAAHTHEEWCAFPGDIALALVTEWSVSNCCWHGALARFSLQGSQLNIRYYNQDLH